MNKIGKGLVLLALAYVAGTYYAAERGGEVVVLETQDPNGTTFRTSLWILDQSGDVWLRADDPGANWLDRLRRDPEVQVMRDGERLKYAAEVVSGVEPRLNEGMREKYGSADALISLLRPREDAVAIRLKVRRPPSSWTQAYP